VHLDFFGRAGPCGCPSEKYYRLKFFVTCLKEKRPKNYAQNAILSEVLSVCICVPLLFQKRKPTSEGCRKSY